MAYFGKMLWQTVKEGFNVQVKAKIRDAYSGFRVHVTASIRNN